MKRMEWLALAFALALVASAQFASHVPASLALAGAVTSLRSQDLVCCDIIIDADGRWFGARRDCKAALEELSPASRLKACEQIRKSTPRPWFNPFTSSASGSGCCPEVAELCGHISLTCKPPEDKCDTKKACEAISAMQNLIARYNGPPGALFGSFAQFNREFSALLQKLSEALACRFNQGSNVPSNASQLKDLVGQILRDKNGFRSLNERSQFPQIDSCIDRSDDRAIRPSRVDACADHDTVKRISENLSRLGGALGCPGNQQAGPPPKTDCKELSNGFLDGLTTFFDQMDELQAKNLLGSGDAYDQVTDGIESAIKEAEDTAREIEGTGGTGAQQLKDIQGKLKTLRQWLDVWKKMKAASCLPPDIQQLLRRLAEEKRAGTEHKATCTELCGATADWYVKISGLAPQRGTFFKACTLACF